jgi:hypothetical protein
MKTRAEILAEAYKIAKAFAENKDEKGARYVCDWNGYIVYKAITKYPLGYSGYPPYILVANDKAEWASPEEIEDIITSL